MEQGFALKEEFRPGETIGFKQYRIITAREVPEVAIKLVELVDPTAGLGATGVRVHDLPATPPRLQALLASQSIPLS